MININMNKDAILIYENYRRRRIVNEKDDKDNKNKKKFDAKKSDLNKDGKISEYERRRGEAIAKAQSKSEDEEANKSTAPVGRINPLLLPFGRRTKNTPPADPVKPTGDNEDALTKIHSPHR